MTGRSISKIRKETEKGQISLKYCNPAANIKHVIYMKLWMFLDIKLLLTSKRLAAFAGN